MPCDGNQTLPECGLFHQVPDYLPVQNVSKASKIREMKDLKKSKTKTSKTKTSKTKTSKAKTSKAKISKLRPSKAKTTKAKTY